MPQFVIETLIDAPAEVCFDLMRDPRLHSGSKVTIEGNREISLGQRVTFESKVVGMLHRLTVEVVECHRPRIFVDELVQGAFTSFRHVHELEENNDTTKLVDTMVWESPWGIAGKLADRMIERRLRAIVHDRNDRLKEIAESTG